MQGCPEHLGEQPRGDAFPGDLAQGLRQGRERVLQWLRGVLLRVRQTAVELEQRVIDRGAALGEVEVGTSQNGHPLAGCSRRPSPSTSQPSSLGTLEGDRTDDVALAPEVAVADRLPVLDALRESAMRSKTSAVQP
jgi:hypothetical protein